MNGGDDARRDSVGNLFAVREGDVIVSLIEMTGRLLGPFES